MNPVDSILIEFKRADEDKRLHIFLTHRELRSDFMAILQQPDDPHDQTVGPAGNGFLGPVRRLHHGFSERLRGIRAGEKKCCRMFGARLGQ